jgi:tetratricopeptide (TPR) repeat protein
VKTTSLKVIIFTVILAVAALFLTSRFINSSEVVKGDHKPVETAFIGPEKYQSGFAKSVSTAQEFFDPYREAVNLMESGQNEAALQALNDILKNASRRYEKSMVYRTIQKIYFEMGDSKKELQAIEAAIEVAGNEELKAQLHHRAAEIRRILKQQQHLETATTEVIPVPSDLKEKTGNPN